ncbi:MAG: YitT family protein [Firmicutes bacterium]|nr:YitT family protein [Bacillota bacterium]
METGFTWSRIKKSGGAAAGVLAGSVLMAVAMNLFLIPHSLAAGGISGFAVILHDLFQVSTGLTIVALNIPLFVVAWLLLGREKVVPSLLGSLAFPAAIELTGPYLPVLTQDLLLASVYGGIVMGLGLGLVFRCQGSTGGTALLSLILNRFTGLSLGQGLLGADLVVISLAVFTLGAEAAMYAVLSLFISTKVIDLVQEGFSPVKVALIITSCAEEITRALLQELDRGVTRLAGRGGYTGAEREVLLCAVSRPQVARLKALIHELDPAAFVIIGTAGEVRGEGFKELSPPH